jgi:hypothetical protein
MKLVSIVSVVAVAVAVSAGAAHAEEHGNADRPDHGSRAHGASSHATAAKAASVRASEGITVGHLMDALHTAQAAMKGKLSQRLNADGLDESAIRDMFEMQMAMNRLSQMSEMSMSIVGASNGALSAMARNIKN